MQSECDLWTRSVCVQCPKKCPPFFSFALCPTFAMTEEERTGSKARFDLDPLPPPSENFTPVFFYIRWLVDTAERHRTWRDKFPWSPFALSSWSSKRILKRTFRSLPPPPFFFSSLFSSSLLFPLHPLITFLSSSFTFSSSLHSPYSSSLFFFFYQSFLLTFERINLAFVISLHFLLLSVYPFKLSST